MYVVRFPAFAKVGERTKEALRAKQEIKRRVLQGEEVVFSQELTNFIEIDAVVEVLELSERGQPVKSSYVVDRAVVKTKEREIPILPEGAEFIAEAGEEGTTFTGPDGKALPEVAQQTLPRVISFDTEDATIDDLYGSDTPRSVGDSWNADDKQALLAMAKAHNAKVDEDGVEGTATLVAAREVDGETLLDIEIKTELKQMIRPSPFPDAEPESAEVTILQKVTMPADYTKGPLSQSHTLSVRQILRGKEGTRMEGQTLDGTTSETRSETYELLPSGGGDAR